MPLGNPHHWPKVQYQFHSCLHREQALFLLGNVETLDTGYCAELIQLSKLHVIYIYIYIMS